MNSMGRASLAPTLPLAPYPKPRSIAGSSIHRYSIHHYRQSFGNYLEIILKLFCQLLRDAWDSFKVLFLPIISRYIWNRLSFIWRVTNTDYKWIDLASSLTGKRNVAPPPPSRPPPRDIHSSDDSAEESDVTVERNFHVPRPRSRSSRSSMLVIFFPYFYKIQIGTALI